MRHIIVTRFSVPRPQDPPNSQRHADRIWLDSRMVLFRRYFVPSTERLAVPVVLLCSSASAPWVATAVADLSGIEVVIQDDWYGGWSGAPDQMVTRHDSDDALHEGWFEALDGAARHVTSPTTEVYCTHEFLRLDTRSERVYAYRRKEPSPLAAFPGGRNPFAHDHAGLERHYNCHRIEGAYLLQVVHGGNLSSRISALAFRRRTLRSRLEPFGLAGPTNRN